MKLSFIKPLHAAWMIEAINSMSEDKQLVKQCWEAVVMYRYRYQDRNRRFFNCIGQHRISVQYL